MLLLCFGMAKLTYAATTSGYSLVFSTISNRSNPTSLAGQSVAGDIYVFITPDANVSQVQFYVDNPAQTGLPYQTEMLAPYDLAGGSASNANPLNTATLSDGPHSITAKILLDSGVTEVTTVNISVVNDTQKPVNRIAVSGPTSGQAGKGLSYKATLYDASNKVITDSTCPVSFNSGAISGSWSPASPSQPVNGVVNTTFTPTKAIQGTLTFSCGTVSTQLTLNVSPGVVKTLGIDTPTTVKSGIASLVKVTLYDAYNNIVTNSTNILQVSLPGLNATFNPASPLSVVNGVGQTNLITGKVGTGTLTITTASGTVTATKTITSAPGLVTKIVVSGPSLIKTNIGSTFTAQLYDGYNQLATNSTDTVLLSVGEVNGTFTPSSSTTAVAGVVTTSLKASTTGNGNATVTFAIGTVSDSLSVKVLKDTDVSFSVINTSQSGQAIAGQFTGFAINFYTFDFYLGRDPNSLNTVFGQLVKNLSNSGGPVNIRLGGSSQDKSWYNPDGRPKENGLSDLTPSERDVIVNFALTNPIRYNMGLNMAFNKVNYAVDWATQIEQLLPQDKILGYTIGNETNIYDGSVLYTDPNTGVERIARPPSYTFQQYLQEYQIFLDALTLKFPSIKIIGPTFTDSADRPSWLIENLDDFLIRNAQDLTLVDYHAYALGNCQGPPYKTVTDLLGSFAAESMADNAVPKVAQAAQYGLGLIISEGNNIITCNDNGLNGVPGVSDAFASALWGTDFLFELANAGVQGFNFMTALGEAYVPVDFTSTLTSASGKPKVYSYKATVKPLYYGMLLFSQATGYQARLLTTDNQTIGNVKIWATKDQSGVVRVVAINKDQSKSGNARIRLSSPRGPGSFTRLTAPSVTATKGVTLAGQTFDGTLDGRPVGSYSSTPLSPDSSGDYTISLPPGQAVMLTVP